MRKRSNVIVVIGLAVFIIGAAATYYVLRDKKESEASTGSASATVLYAAQEIPVGTAGSSAVDQGLVKTKSVDAAPAGALTDPAQLAGKTAASAVPQGSVITSTAFPQTQTGIGTLKIPEGKIALALQLGYVQGVAGFARAGDHIDIFGVSKDVGAGGGVRLVLQNMQVLNVSTAAVAAGQQGGPEPIFLLAATPPEAESLVYLATYQKLYFGLVPRDQAPVAGTPGAGQPGGLELLP